MDEYLHHRAGLVSIGELSRNTLRSDEQALKRLLEALGDLPLRQIAGKVDTFKVRMLAGAVDIEKRKNTIDSHIGHLSSAFAWAAAPDRATGRQAYINRNPFAESRTEKIRFRGIERLPKYLEHAEIRALRRQLDAEIMQLRTDIAQMSPEKRGNPSKSLRSRVRFRQMLEFYIYTGMRASELTGLFWGDIRLHEGFIHLKQTKGRKERTIPIAPPLAKLIEEMGPKDIGRVFALTAGHVSDMFRDLVKRAGLKDTRTLHGLRHSFGTLSVSAGVDLDVVQHIMGHKSISTTQIYVDVQDSRKAEQMKEVRFG